MDGRVASSYAETAKPILAALQLAHGREKLELELLNAHYLGKQPLSYMAPELIMELGDRMRQVVVHWPELVVDSKEERLDVEGFCLGGRSEADAELWGIWQANNLDLLSHQAQVDSAVMRRSYIIVGTRSEADVDPSSGVGVDVPLVTVESPLEVFASRDPRTRRVNAAAKWWCSPGENGRDVDHVTLYLPNSTAVYSRQKNRKAGGPEWTVDEAYPVDEHGLGVVPVVPLVNRPRTSARSGGAEGTSDLDAVIPLSDAACKIASDMMVGAEFHSLPRRWATGVTAEDFTDPSGRPVSALSRIAGRIWAFAGSSEDVKVGQFAESGLSNFHSTIELLASLVASIAGLPPHYMGQASENPSSADAIRSGEARLVKRVERAQRALGEGYEQAMRIALLFRDRELPDGAARMETKWRDASTPTIAQSADAAVKLFAAGIVPRRQTWNRLGFSATEQALMEQEYDREAERAARSFGLGQDSQMPGEVVPADSAEDAALEEPVAPAA